MEKKQRPDGITVIAVFEFVLAALSLLMALCSALLAVAPLMAGETDPVGIGVMLLLFGGGFVVCVAYAIAAIAAGWGLLKMRNWARWVSIVLAVLLLLAFPLGTLCGGLILWFLLKEDVSALFTAR